ncbi:MAG: hypothetical protein ACT4P0_06675 [Panacagrimonas sp.]
MIKQLSGAAGLLLLAVTHLAAAQGPIFPQPLPRTPFQFALIGDTPYNVPVGSPSAPFDDMVGEVNGDPFVRFVMHAGDIKSGSERCSDELFADRLARFQKFSDPFVITPGDNEWTDCHRVNNGAYQPLERLAKLRQLLYPVPGQTLGQRVARVDSQAGLGYPENMRWVHHRVVFATLHVVGSQNGLAAFDPASPVKRGPEDDAEVAARSAATLAWMNEAFDLAQSRQAAGVFLLMQANPGLEFITSGVDRTCFESLLAQLEGRTRAFGKPVVLAHGDSHYFRIDKPRIDQIAFLPNFTRVETFGAANVHWIRVRVNPLASEVFSFDPEIVPLRTP